MWFASWVRRLARHAPPSAHAAGIRAEGVIRTATGSGRVPFVDADDIAAVAVRTLPDAHAPGTDPLLTGPQALSNDDIAAILTEVTGRVVVHHRLSYEQLRAHLTAFVAPAFASMPAGMDRDNRRGSGRTASPVPSGVPPAGADVPRLPRTRDTGRRLSGPGDCPAARPCGGFPALPGAAWIQDRVVTPRSQLLFHPDGPAEILLGPARLALPLLQ